MNVVQICTMIVNGVQLVLVNQIHVVYVNVMVMLNDVDLILFDMLKQITHRVVFVKIVNIIQLDHDVNFVKIFSTKIILCLLLIHKFVNVSQIELKSEKPKRQIELFQLAIVILMEREIKAVVFNMMMHVWVFMLVNVFVKNLLKDNVVINVKLATIISIITIHKDVKVDFRFSEMNFR